MPGGTSRQASFWKPYPLTIDRGSGARFHDIDGHSYLDLINNYTAMVHGHAYPAIVAATQQQIAKGTAWAAANEPQSRLAALIVDRIPSVEQVRFTNSGSEAGALAFTIARIITGRTKLLMARYGYHGSPLEFEVGFFGNEGPITHLATYNDLAEFEAVLDEHGHDIAAVFLEPVMGASGIIQGDPDFLHGVRAAAHKAGALFVLDEVLTLRFSSGGCQADIGIEPDLTMLGKIIGGGFPVGAVAGSADTLRIFDPADMKVFHTGTFNGNPVTMVAGEVSLRELTPDRIERMEHLCKSLQSGLIAAANRHGLPFSTNRYGSCLNIYFSQSAPEFSVLRDDDLLMDRFHLACINHGLFIAQRGLIALSTVITEKDIAEALERADMAMCDVVAETGE
ncbi:MAG: aminotransferase class III-fold pyridoxal phosphate-dependent enzyme [Gammaproteobacteria bacterium]|jgi:glutamate-1-semialdehyde 2,1-aminomutase|nr:aminotransferase class III-fold pyridoxal phosphate-dependent enzyme [Gammaproteobacteria bacterium]